MIDIPGVRMDKRQGKIKNWVENYGVPKKKPQPYKEPELSEEALLEAKHEMEERQKKIRSWLANYSVS